MIIRAKRPDGSRCQEIPFVIFFEKFATFLYGHPHIDPSGLDVFGNPTFEWLSYHGQPIPVQKSSQRIVAQMTCPHFLFGVSA